MANYSYTDNLARGLQHVGGHAEWDHDNAIMLLSKDEGSRTGCLSSLKSLAEARSMISWFRDHDLTAHKQWAYIAAKLNRMYFQLEPWTSLPAYKHLYALLSDHPAINDWYRQHKLPYFLQGEIKDKENPKQGAFHGYQALLALNGQWDELRTRCELILGMELKKDRKYLIDHRFYLALANGDQQSMEAILTELTSPKIARVRNFEFEFAFTENFISTYAVIYAKIAWRHGYQLEIDTPWIPKEWLPIQALPQYEDPWPFMQEFDIWQPFEGDWVEFSPQTKG